MTPFSLRQLRYFVSTVENGGIAPASRQLNISQPSISVAIKDLEASFGLQLFVRHRNSGMALTSAGHRFFRHATTLLRHAREFEQNALSENGVVAGELSLACFETLAALHAPSLIASFKQRYPGTILSLFTAAQERIVEGLRSGVYDLAICYDHGLPQTVERVALLPDLFPRVVLPSGHRFSEREEVSLAMLAEEPIILLDIWPSNEYFLGIFARAGVSPHVAYKASSLEMVRGLVGQGLGVSILVTEPVNAISFAGQEIVSVRITDPMMPSRTVMAWHSSTELTPCTRAFLHHCQSEIRSPLGRLPFGADGPVGGGGSNGRPPRPARVVRTSMSGRDR